jgi:hypothetical protein
MIDTQREAFEKAVEQAYEKPTLTSIERDGDGYMDGYVDNAWWGWRAALDQAEADKADLVKQCARVANEYRLDKHGHMRLVDVMMALLLKE